MTSRVVCKLREIISEVTGNSRSDYVNSLRDEHRAELLQGRKAYAIDNGGSEITLFVPWRLHRPVESLFSKISVNNQLSSLAFRQLVDDAELFPKSQNVRKKDDIVEYIVGRVVESGSLDFEQFLHALFLMAKYRASVLRVTEQCAFNHMLSVLIAYVGRTVPQDQDSEKPVDQGAETEDQPSIRAACTSVSKNGDIVRSLSSVTIRDTDLLSPSPSEGEPMQKGVSQALSDDNSEPNLEDEDIAKGSSLDFHPSGRVSSVSVATEPAFVQTPQTEQLFRMAEDKMNETCELLKNELLIMRAQLDDYKVQESHKQELINTISLLKTDKEELEKHLASNKAAALDAQQKLENTITDLNDQLHAIKNSVAELEEQLLQAKKQLEAAEEYRSHQQQIQTMIALHSEYETMLFSAFVSYRDDKLVGGEFVMSEDNCVAFCLDFGLDELQVPVGSTVDPAAKLAFREISKSAPSGKLTYGLFKEFLLRLAEIVDPQSTQKRAFQLLVLNTICRRMEEDKRDLHPPSGQHLVAADDFGRLPFDVYPEHHVDGLRHEGHDDSCDSSRYIDVEGKMWFEEEQGRAPPQPQNENHTPRFNR
ncbi:hypothetical protein BaOVIS_026250 [Babesia ovis]|uniref:Uncharacterized protein n=1 Tax=Babesia ovis TaxID=5869 RepID=A0A9W5TD72_BABOV|nr:hypothetical protein BaOVIS_026250 [Babesia ovis]